ncbi:MAG: (d)CMP kinase [Chloroflexota bacterium]|nr:(d)CMP kinase [Chloroflexota bacterium]
MSKPSTIAIDGPVAGGKSTVGRLLAQRLGYRFVDTGMMYRGVTWKALQCGVDLEDRGELGRLARNATIEFAPVDRVLVDGRDVTAALSEPDVEEGVSLVSRVACVREALVERQRELARDGQVVMAGRDIGTVVLPHADVKVYLDASLEERARRRHLELVERGEMVDYQAVLSGLRRRDEIDSGREVSPLRAAQDATLVDTDGLAVEQVLSRIMELAGAD